MASRKQQKERLRAERLEHEAEEQAGERRRRLIQYGSAAVLLALGAVAVLIVLSQSGADSGGDTQIEGTAQVEAQLKGIHQAGIVLGDPDAQVSVVEYADLQCPVCRVFADEVGAELISGPVRRGEVRYDFRQWAILGPDSVAAAKAALAAGEQGRYWEFVELFYRNQGRENSGYVTDDFLEAIAEGAGVPDIAQWNQDRDSSRWDSQIQANSADATSLGFTGTPSILVRGPGGPVSFQSVPTLPRIEAAIRAAR